MKKCPNCSKEYEYGVYCSICGVRLVDEAEIDIFGDPINDKTYQKETINITAQNDEIVKDTNNLVQNPNLVGVAKYLSLISVCTFFIPLYGFLISIAAVALSIASIQKTNNKKQIAYFVISLVTLVLSLVFFVLLLKSGVLSDIMNLKA